MAPQLAIEKLLRPTMQLTVALLGGLLLRLQGDMFNTHWDVDKYRCEHESAEHWSLRKQFMLAHKDKFPESRLVCLTQVFFNMEFLGCKYPNKTMELVNKLAAEVAREFREGRKGKLKRTFVGAQDAAGAKAKGSIQSQESIERTQKTHQPEAVEYEPVPKKLSIDDTPETSEEPSGRKAIDFDDVKNLPIDAVTAATLREIAETFVLLFPIRANSKTEGDPVMILQDNFPKKMTVQFHGSKMEGGWNCEIRVNPKPGDPHGTKPKHLIASYYAPKQREGKIKAATIAIERLKKYCTYIEPNPEWFKEGKTPDFIIDRIQCNKRPRTYIIFTKQEVGGHITNEVADILMKNFKESSNEEMFFLNEEFSEKEKINLMNRSQIHQLGFRHFGQKVMLKEHHVCIYKKKSAAEIMEEARKLQWKHPRYIITFKQSETR